MPRSLIFGNGNILVGLDVYGRVRDFYYPYIGQENQSHKKIHRLGIWVDGRFSWIEDASWERQVLYKKETLVGDIRAKNNELAIALQINDCVHSTKNIFIRKVTVTNLSSSQREIRLFFHQDFAIAESDFGDTVYYNPIVESIIHYKRKRYFLMNGQHTTGTLQGFTSYTTGIAGAYGKLGTYVDAEDGILEKNNIEHGPVDSTIAFHATLNPEQEHIVYYWICVGQDFESISKLNRFILKQKPQTLVDTTENHWNKWVNTSPFKFEGLSDQVIELFKRSLLIGRTHFDNHGAIIASGDADMLYFQQDDYAYMWPRDGALISRAFDRAGYSSLTKEFFSFCCKHLTDEGYFFHKYRPDGSLGSSWLSWLKEGQIQLPIQEDQIALVLEALWKHFEQNNDKKFIGSILDCCIRKMADFLIDYIDAPTGLVKESYDLWEEKLGIHTFTCATVYGGLVAAGKFEHHFHNEENEKKYRQAAYNLQQNMFKYLYDPERAYFIKGVYYKEGVLHKDMTVDASTFYGLFNYKVVPLDDERLQSTIKLTHEKLFCGQATGGYARYEGDTYYHRGIPQPGNPWFITTLWFAEYYIDRATSRKELYEAVKIFNWVSEKALPSGILAEQLDQYTGIPLSIAPLTWSHAEFVTAIVKYLQKLDDLGVCEMCNPPKLRVKDI